MFGADALTRMKIDIYDMFIKPILASLFMEYSFTLAYRRCLHKQGIMLATRFRRGRRSCVWSLRGGFQIILKSRP